MNWADKLIEKIKTFTLMLEGFPDGKYLDVDDLVLAVLEKNKEIDKISSTYEWRKAQARAFRELVQACEKVKTK